MDAGLFAWLDRSPDELRAAAEQALEAKRARLETIIAIPSSERTFLNTIGALQYADDELADIMQQSDLLLSIHPDAAIRDTAQSVADHIDEENVQMEFDRRLWRAVQDWEATHETLDAVDRKLADDVIRDMRRMGFALPDDTFEELKRNVTELRKLQTQFEKAINDWEDFILVTREELSGLPESYIAGLARDGEQYRVSLEYPDLFPFMRLAENDAARLALVTKDYLRGGQENLRRLASMISLRQANAKLLGFPTHADYVLEPKMAKTSVRVHSFLEGIINNLKPLATREHDELLAFKSKHTGSGADGALRFHEKAFWAHRQYRELYDIDAEKVKEFFPTTHVVGAMLDMFAGVLGVSYRRMTDVGLWHPDVVCYEVTDGDVLVGRFVLDLYPRKGKYGHAAAFPGVLGRIGSDGQRVPGFMALVCNFPKPTVERPSLLTHDEVETLLHEFGHVMHALLSGRRWQRLNGYGVAHDFVEALSQLFEEWAWDPVVLQKLTSHYRTGETMPDELRSKLIAARHHMDATMYLAQAVSAKFDMTIHSQPTDSVVDARKLADTYRAMRLEIEGIDLPASSLFPAGWSHMADYDAGYYGYLWSKVYALDMYTRFASDPLSPSAGAAYRTQVLEPGASGPELELVRSFLGREPSNAPFLAALGMQEAVDKSS